MRVAHVCSATDGAEWMVRQAIAARTNGYEVVAVIASAEGETARLLRDAGVPFVAMPARMMGWRRPQKLIRAMYWPHIGPVILRAMRLTAVLGNALQLARFLRRSRIDIVHAQIYQSIIIGRLAAWLARTPIRISMVPGPYHLEVSSLRRVDLRTRWIDTVTVSGCGRTDDLYAAAGVPATKRRIIRYGADTSVFDPARADRSRFRAELGVADDTPLIGQVAVFYPPAPVWSTTPLVGDRGVKGHEDFIDAANLLLERRPEARFVLVGRGWGELGEVYRQSMIERVRDLGLNGRVTFTGNRTDIPDVLAALDVSVQCSLSENYGGTVESLMLCRPTIATRVGGMPEAVRHEDTGLLVPPRDPKALAAAMERLVDDRELGARLGAAGRELMLAGFTAQGMCDNVCELYAQLVGQKLPRRAIPTGSLGV